MPANVVVAPERAAEGEGRIQWARANMPVLRSIEAEARADQRFAGLRVAVSVHLEAKTAYLARVFAAGGAQVAVSGSNPGSTRDEVVAALAAGGIHTYARYDATPDEFTADQLAALEIAPHLVIDDGGDLVHHLHEAARAHAGEVIGACEETTAGVVRDRAREAAGALAMPVLAVNYARMKHLFDNRYGTGQSTMDALMRATNTALTGKTILVVGFGWCGRGIAARAAGMGMRVLVSEVDEFAAIEAAMEGYHVLPAIEALAEADVVVTATGTAKTLAADHFAAMRDGAILANAGHFADEIDVHALYAMAAEPIERPRTDLECVRMADGTTRVLIAQGRIVNIAAADGHPAEIMDTSFAVQALSASWLITHGRSLAPGVHVVPEEIDREVARRRLAAMGTRIDTLTDEQRAYLAGFDR